MKWSPSNPSMIYVQIIIKSSQKNKYGINVPNQATPTFDDIGTENTTVHFMKFTTPHFNMETVYRVRSSPHIHLAIQLQMKNAYLLRLRKLDQLLLL